MTFDYINGTAEASSMSGGEHQEALNERGDLLRAVMVQVVSALTQMDMLDVCKQREAALERAWGCAERVVDIRVRSRDEQHRRRNSWPRRLDDTFMPHHERPRVLVGIHGELEGAIGLLSAEFARQKMGALDGQARI